MADLSMLHNELSAQFFANGEPTVQEWRQLRDAGVSLEALCRPVMVLAGSIVCDRPAGFSFAGDGDADGQRALLKGQRALLIAIEEREGLLDIAAWQPARDWVGLYLGRAWALGQERVLYPRVEEDGALPVWRSPLDWLRASRQGLVLIRPRAAAFFLDDAGPLLAEDLAHAAELRTVLTRPAPRILVRVPSQRAA